MKRTIILRESIECKERVIISMPVTRTWRCLIPGAALILTFAILSVVLSSGFAENPPNRGIKNVLFILLDALRADHLGIYGYPRNTSPNIDRLAREGIVFDRAIVQAGWTPSSIPSYFTSTYPGVHKTSQTDRFPRNLTTMAEIFRDNGYFTYGFYGIDTVGTYVGFNKGFHLYLPDQDTEIVNNARFALTKGYFDESIFDEEGLSLFSHFLQGADKLNLNLVNDSGFEYRTKHWIQKKKWVEEDTIDQGFGKTEIIKDPPG